MAKLQIFTQDMTSPSVETLPSLSIEDGPWPVACGLWPVACGIEHIQVQLDYNPSVSLDRGMASFDVHDSLQAAVFCASYEDHQNNTARCRPPWGIQIPKPNIANSRRIDCGPGLPSRAR